MLHKYVIPEVFLWMCIPKLASVMGVHSSSSIVVDINGNKLIK